jgi:hypothetical protein
MILLMILLMTLLMMMMTMFKIWRHLVRSIDRRDHVICSCRMLRQNDREHVDILKTKTDQKLNYSKHHTTALLSDREIESKFRWCTTIDATKFDWRRFFFVRKTRSLLIMSAHLVSDDCVRTKSVAVNRRWELNENFLIVLSKLRCKERQSWWNEMRWNEVCDEEKRAKHFDLLSCVRTMNVQKFCLQYESRTLKKIEKKKTHDHLIVDYFLSHDHVQTQNFCVLYVFRTNAQNSLSLILYLMMTFRRRIFVFCMSFVRMLKILYFWFFVSWWRSDAEFLCFVCLSYECS